MIKVKNLTKKFNGFTAVNNISFEVKKGEIFVFLGPNGAGKTTTIRMLTTLLHPTSGEMQINGYNPIKEPAKENPFLEIKPSLKVDRFHL